MKKVELSFIETDSSIRIFHLRGDSYLSLIL